MPDERIKVLIADDSAFMRNALSRMISSDPELQVIGTARDGIETVDKVSSLRPDIVTLDVEMPRMNGLEALKVIMETNPVPVLMVSSLTSEGAEVTLEALDAGAVDFIPKNLADLSVNILKIRELLLEKLKAIGRRGIVRRKAVRRTPLPHRKTFEGQRRISLVAIGSSTGGPKALQEVLPHMPEDLPVGIVIAQHMPPSFTGPFAERLDSMCKVHVKEAEHGEPVRPGTVMIAPGGKHMKIVRRRTLEVTAEIVDGEEGAYIYRPSVDLLMLSATKAFPGRTLGVILTGMGNDGLRGMEMIKRDNGKTIAQSEETCVVYGMPKAVVDAGIADKVVPLEEIAGEIINSV
ncbi:MAG TPA: chemotaxis response regulator protein-glutamate methylesterase [Nitrospirae bacterium]|nr:chemotaxis response regulator protein-glutamate methylesterase [Nitrospirota bacterium]